MSESEFTINVKVNGLEDVERLREAFETLMDGRVGEVQDIKHPEVAAPAKSEYWGFTLEDRAYTVLRSQLPAIHKAIAKAGATSADAPKFDPGDTVRLKSGGPVMTITAIDGDSAYVTWLRRLDSLDSWDAIPQYDATAAREDFPLSCLEHA